MYSLLRPLVFRLDPERAHHLSLGGLRLAGGLAPARALLRARYAVRDARLEVRAFGLRFPNPIGLAAGYDKDGVALRGLAALGFGHLEAGTLTLRPQPGNPRPRIRRFPAARALVNSMGFPNAGVEAFRPATRAQLGDTLLGVNLGKGKATELSAAAADYVGLFERVAERADYVAINVSSPNTPGLRELQTRAFLEELLGAVTTARDARAARGARTPILVKIAPDMDERQLDDVLEAIAHTGVDGVIATNTTLDRSGLPDEARELPGGTSGAPLGPRSTEFVRRIARRTEGRLPIVGVGGVLSGADALEKLRAGATLVQVYTGLVYAGPGLVRSILRELLRACDREGASNVGDLRR